MIGIAKGHRHPLARLLDLGTGGYEAAERRPLNVMNATAALIAVSSSIYALSYAISDAHGYRWIIAINLALVAMAFAVPAMHRINQWAGGLLIISTELPALFSLVALLGRNSGIQLNLIVGAAAAIIVSGSARPFSGLATVSPVLQPTLAPGFCFRPAPYRSPRVFWRSCTSARRSPSSCLSLV